jgi:hypothetical protein
VRYYRPDDYVSFMAVASTTPEGQDYTFLHWGWDPSTWQDPTNYVYGSYLSGITTNEDDVVDIDYLVAIFKKTSLIPAPLVNNPPEMMDMTSWYFDPLYFDAITYDRVLVQSSA